MPIVRCPGSIVDRSRKDAGDEAGISRYGQPEEIADLIIAFFVSPAARWMTGAAVGMDGGEATAI
jgi:NAD(P)-dependent dehydrogenase (short-subunit alcohol dehydrogenase family)